ncbi:MAG: acyltransferase family protein, partial [Actinobacteria bacterium]|nr:acyltransferase family protein [Actinomycetota bacterium]
MSNVMEKSNSYRPDIQGLRAIAILIVVCYHSGIFFKSGFVGVDVFFAISGYVISSSLIREIEGNGRIRVSQFYARRIRRLLPALAVMLSVVLFASTWLSAITARVQTIRTGIFATFSASNLFLFRFRPDGYFVVGEKTNALLHTWSLSIEEQFYLLFPILMIVAMQVVQKYSVNIRVGIRYVCGLVGVISLAICIGSSIGRFPEVSGKFSRILGTTSVDARFAFYLPFARAWEFLAGVILATFSFKSARNIGKSITAYLGLALIIGSALFLHDATSFPGFWALIPIVGALNLLSASRTKGPVNSLLTSKAMCWIGDRSYGWYLWHWPMIQFTKPFWPDNRFASTSAALFALVPAAISYRWIENRLRSSPVWRTKNKMGLLIACSLLVPLLMGATSRDLSPELDYHLDAKMGCEYGDLANLDPHGKCAIPVADSNGYAVLIGDSHAGMLSEGFVTASHKIGLDAVIAVNGNNPFLFRPWDMETTRNEYPYQAIESWEYREVKPSVVVIAQSGYVMGNTDGSSWSVQFIPILKRLAELGIPAVVAEAAVGANIEPRSCSPLQDLVGKCPANISRSTLILDENRSGRTIEEMKAVVSVNNAVLMDALPVLCPSSECQMRRNGEWWWRDNAHISITASPALEPLIAK